MRRYPWTNAAGLLNRALLAAVFLVLVQAFPGPALAQSDPIVALPSDVFSFRDRRTPNQTGFFIGDRLAVGIVSVTPNPENGLGGDLTTVTARQNTTETNLPFIGGVFGGQYVNSVPFDPTLTGIWELTVANTGSPNTPVVVNSPAVGPTSLVPFVTDGTMTPAGLTPTISWVQPSGFTPDNQRIFITDLDRQSADGSALVMHRQDISAAATSFAIPAILENGDPLSFGGRYEILVMLQDLRSNGSPRSRSRTFYSFTPLVAGPTVQLPVVGPDGIFTFDLGVTAGGSVVLDPDVAVGYRYQVGAGDPLFASVRILSDVGDGLYNLRFFDGSGVIDQLLGVGDLFTFPVAIGDFEILGIEPGAGVDPRNATAFLTEVTFAGDGRFTGTMTPIEVHVAEPPAAGLLAAGCLALLFLTPRRRGFKRNIHNPR